MFIQGIHLHNTSAFSSTEVRPYVLIPFSLKFWVRGNAQKYAEKRIAELTENWINFSRLASECVAAKLTMTRSILKSTLYVWKMSSWLITLVKHLPVTWKTWVRFASSPTVTFSMFYNSQTHGIVAKFHSPVKCRVCLLRNHLHRTWLLHHTVYHTSSLNILHFSYRPWNLGLFSLYQFFFFF